MSLQGKTALITGGTSGMGSATARAMAQKGASVIITGRDETRGASTVEGIRAGGHDAQFIAADFSEMSEVARVAEAAGEIDVLVNLAGVAAMGPTVDTDEAAFDGLFQINVKAPFFLVAALAPKIAARGGGSIINVSTMVASYGQPGLGAYGASRAAIELLTKAWAAEFGPHNFRVNAVAPGPTLTPTWRRNWRWPKSSPRRFLSAASLTCTSCPTSSRSLRPRLPATSTGRSSPSMAAASRLRGEEMGLLTTPGDSPRACTAPSPGPPMTMSVSKEPITQMQITAEKTVLITGANVGIGKDIARQLASRPETARIYMACRNQDRAAMAKAELEAETGRRIFDIVLMDVSDPDSVRAGLAGIDGSIDALVMNAGGMGGKTPMKLTARRSHLHVRAERSWPRCPARDAPGRGAAWRGGGLRRKRGSQGNPENGVQAAVVRLKLRRRARHRHRRQLFRRRQT